MKRTNQSMGVKQLEDKYSGERIFVIGNGPSLNETPLQLLEREYSIALNRINLIYNDTTWRPDFYVSTKKTHSNGDESHIRENIESGCHCFINETHQGKFGDYANLSYIKRRKLPADPLTVLRQKENTSDLTKIDEEVLLEIWSEDIDEGVYQKHSMYAVFQIVSYLGFDEIYLVGCDLGFKTQKPYLLFSSGEDPCEYSDKIEFIKDSFSNRSLVRSFTNGIMFKIIERDIAKRILYFATDMHNDKSHFNGSYKKNLRYKDLNQEFINGHKVAKRILNDRDIEIYNATIGGELEVYPRVDLRNVVSCSEIGSMY